MGIQVKAGNTDFKIVSYTVIAMIEAYNSTKDFGMIDISSFSTSTLNDHPSFVPMAPIRVLYIYIYIIYIYIFNSKPKQTAQG